MIGTVNWKGASGVEYSFGLDPIGTAFIPRCGVYIFAKQVAPGQWLPGYVGMTGDFDQRLNTGLKQHHAWPSVLAFGATHICTLHFEGGEAECRRVEADLCQGLNPSCNKVLTRGTSFFGGMAA